MKKTIKIDDEFGSRFKGEYMFESIPWGLSNRISSDCTKIDPATRLNSIDMKKMQAMMLDKTLVKRPNVITLELLMSENTDHGLPLALGDILMEVADYVNGYGPESRKRLKKFKRRCGLE